MAGERGKLMDLQIRHSVKVSAPTPVRRGHEVSLITTAHRRPRVLALANWTTIDGVNCARSVPPGLMRMGDLLWLAAGFVGLTGGLGDAGMVPFVPGAVVLLVAMAAARSVPGGLRPIIGNRLSGESLSPGFPHSPFVRGRQAAASKRSVTSPAAVTVRA